MDKAIARPQKRGSNVQELQSYFFVPRIRENLDCHHARPDKAIARPQKRGYHGKELQNYLKLWPYEGLESTSSRLAMHLPRHLCYDYLRLSIKCPGSLVDFTTVTKSQILRADVLLENLTILNVNNLSNSCTWIIQISIRWPVHLEIYPFKGIEPMTSRKSYNLLKRMCYDYLQLSIKCPRSLVDFTTVTKSQI